MTALLFVGAADGKAAAEEATPIHHALKGLVSQFKDSVLTSELKKFSFEFGTPFRTGCRIQS